jgi:hypothetical protein
VIEMDEHVRSPPVILPLRRLIASPGLIGSKSRADGRAPADWEVHSSVAGEGAEYDAMKNYAGHRLSPWLGHLMVSRQETARSLLTPGEIMQLPPDDELVPASGRHPIRAKKGLVLSRPALDRERNGATKTHRPSGQRLWGAPPTGAGWHHS